MAGGPSASNPEPLAPFVDVFFMGEAEEGLLRVVSILDPSAGWFSKTSWCILAKASGPATSATTYRTLAAREEKAFSEASSRNETTW